VLLCSYFAVYFRKPSGGVEGVGKPGMKIVM
jgi:hypothetical protein